MEQRFDLSIATPAGFRAVFGLEKYVQGALDHTVLYLIKVRASMVNGCAFCVDMHTTDALKDGESSQRLFGLAAWNESALYDERERAALALTDAVTHISQRGVPDEVWAGVVEHFGEEGAVSVLLAVGTINLWNRLIMTSRKQPVLAA
ncbi:carboxymuconolactone decarboxylase family protein [Kribbella sp. CA-247076]|uniref:carboxymuconolactone decarboxylase family protein n=1 Tax=Kribbella sp. CA-247076 TaxID=3239941 RepID=UPI003D8F8EF0